MPLKTVVYYENLSELKIVHLKTIKCSDMKTIRLGNTIET